MRLLSRTRERPGFRDWSRARPGRGTGQTKTFSNGRILVTGALREEVSANGKTVSLNIPGPATIVVAPDGSATLYGRGVGAGDFMTPDGLEFLQVAGSVSVPLDGSIPPLQGHVLLDVCTALS
jgi:hypothetical protein